MRTCILTFMVIPYLLITIVSYAQKLAPVNPDLVKYIANKSTGMVPPPVVLPPIKGNMHIMAVYPSRFDLRTIGKCSPVQDQGNVGNCWTFACLASLEGCMLPKDSANLSELHMANRNLYDFGIGEGGNPYMATAYMASWIEPVLESDDPYSDMRRVSPDTMPVYGHLQNNIMLPSRTSFSDNNTIKYCLTKYGPVDISLFWTSNGYTASTSSFYDNVQEGTNHEVSIIGWDDNYSRNNFSAFSGTPAGDGAFLFKNSWGTGWGQSGFGWVSYYDANLGSSAACQLPLEPATNYQHIYQYDPLGWTSNLGYGSNTAYAAAVYTAKSTEQIEAIAFYAPVATCAYEAKIFLDPTDSPVAGQAYGKTMGFTDLPGYVTVKLASPVPVTAGQKFSVVLRLLTADYDYPIAVELVLNGYSSKAAAEPGQTFCSHDGETWEDLTAFRSDVSVCLKAFGKPANPTRSISGKIDLGTDLGYLQYVGLQAQVKPTNVTGDTVDVPLKRHIDGEYTINWLPEGSLDLRIGGGHYLAATAYGLNTNLGNAYMQFSLLNGDADGDNQINMFDMVVLDSAFGMSDLVATDSLLGTSSAMADLNGDGVVNLFDYAIIDQNFGAKGSPAL